MPWHKPTKKLTGQQSFCTACGEYFTTTANFDKHRVWEHRQFQRRCLDASEITRKGLIQRPDGFWTSPPPRNIARSTEGLGNEAN